MRRHSSRRAWILAVFSLVNILDMATTHIGLAAGIPEGNPIPAMLIATHGEWAWLAAKAGICSLVVGAVLVLHQYPRLWWSLYVTSAVLAMAVVSNLGLILG